jgi:putative NADH-flavin reductase
MSTIALVGASGNLGHKLLSVLEAADTVSCIHSLSRHVFTTPTSPKVKTFQVDYLNLQHLEDAIRGCDVLINAMGTNTDHVQNKINLVDAAAKVGVKVYFPRSLSLSSGLTKQ